MKPATMKLFRLILSLIIVIASVVLCQQIISNSTANQQIKNDYAELNQVKYGLFSIDEWKRQITAILTEEINKLYLSKENEQVLRGHIEVLLNTLIDKVDKKIRKGNSDTAGGKLTQSFINIFINLDDIKKGIPEYADAVIRELKKSKTREQIKTVLSEQLDQYASQTFETQDTSRLRSILSRTGSADIESARKRLNEEISLRQGQVVKQAGLLILLALVLFVLSGLDRQPLTTAQYVFLVLSLGTLLMAGVTTPMIDMEATISQMHFMLMGHPIHFENQVLYFQSKSILDVFWIMITHQEIQMKLVGVLLVTFSIVFPLLKIASTLVYYFDYRRARENPVIRFFVISSGKWSMADVMVVAIFMAYIGFNGIISSQLGLLNTTDQEMVILTTNSTSLQPGYYLFLTYTLLALFLSEMLTRKPRA
jgi:hypothetical protein